MKAGADAEVARLQATLRRAVDEHESKFVSVRARERDTKIQLGRLDGELQTARAEARALSEQHGAAIAAMTAAEDTHAETKQRLDTFRESYQVAQSYLNAANVQIEKGKVALAAARTDRRRLQQEHEEDAQPQAHARTARAAPSLALGEPHPGGAQPRRALFVGKSRRGGGLVELS